MSPCYSGLSQHRKPLKFRPASNSDHLYRTGANSSGHDIPQFLYRQTSSQQASEADFRPGPQGQPRDIPPGDYEVTLTVGDKKLTQKARVLS